METRNKASYRDYYFGYYNRENILFISVYLTSAVNIDKVAYFYLKISLMILIIII